VARLFVLNDDLKWDDIDAEARGAFQTKFGMPTKDTLTPGFLLYKFTDFTRPSADGTKLSPWWSPYDAYKQDPGWEMRLRAARSFGVSIREWGRVTSAIKENWNSCANLLVISLNVDACAFFGGFASMIRLDPGAAGKALPGDKRGATRSLPGGATQFYLPNLTMAHIGRWYTESLVGQ
jgi:hypothetical protein